MTVYWRCSRCEASGEGDKAAEQHVKDTSHGVFTSSRRWES